MVTDFEIDSDDYLLTVRMTQSDDLDEPLPKEWVLNELY